MLPRSKGPAHAGRHGGMDSRKVVLIVMVLVFAAYFAIVNTYFSFSAPKPGAAGALAASDEINANPRGGVYKNTKIQAAQGEKESVPAETPKPKWQRNPNRKYVWLDVAIDDVFVGRVTAELYTDLVPKTAENFRTLTTGELGPKYSYKNSVCHRILTGFIVQCGDFTTGKGYGGRSIYGGKFDDEPNGLRLTHSKRYILQMANSGPNTNGSQFCFMLNPAQHLNGKHVVFGEVVEGFEVVDKMEAAGVDRDGVPLAHKVSFTDGGEYL